MKKRLLSWLLVLTMVTSLIPSTLVTTAFAADNTSAQASGQAGKTTVNLDNKWPGDMNADITDVLITGTTIPGPTLTVESGKTLIVHGSGTLSGTGRRDVTPFFIVKDGGHLVLDQVTISGNKSDSGTVVVEKGGLLDLGYNDQKDRIAPGITDNTMATQTNAARNLVIADGATVRLNAAATKAIGVSYSETLYQPVSMMQGGRYTLQDSDVASSKINPDSVSLELVLCNDQFVLKKKHASFLYWDPDRGFDKINSGADSGWLKSVATQQINNVFGKVKTTNGMMVQKNELRSNTYGVYQSLDQYTVEQICGFDFIEIAGPLHELKQTDLTKLNAFLNTGGRIYIQTEAYDWIKMNTAVTKVAKQLNGEFSMDSVAGISNKRDATAKDNIVTICDNDTAKKRKRQT